MTTIAFEIAANILVIVGVASVFPSIWSPPIPRRPPLEIPRATARKL
jgi:hypothetical protein